VSSNMPYFLSNFSLKVACSRCAETLKKQCELVTVFMGRGSSPVPSL
jgi:hypothetical protein